MKIVKACELFYKLASIDAKLLLPTLVPTIKAAIKSALEQSNALKNFSSNFFPKLGTEVNSVSFNVTIDTPYSDKISFESQKNVTVSNFVVDPISQQETYAKLPEEIQNYLSSNNDLFPTKSNEEDVTYNNLTITIQYP
jgi:hypothetical protein